MALPPHLRAKVLEAGFRTVGDLERVRGPLDLAREAGISPEEAHEVLQLVGGRQVADWRAGAVSAVDLYRTHLAARRIVTFSSDLDRILGGGVFTGQVTEFCGVPGVGKTQLGLQLAVDAQIPEALGGVGGQAVYIDTEGSFMVERCVDVAEGVMGYLSQLASRQAAAGRPQLVEALQRSPLADLRSVLQNIFLFRIHNHVEQVSLVNLLPQFLKQNPQVRLVVVDSIAFHFRQDFSDMAQRSRTVTAMAQQLIAAAQAHDVAVVLMNQVTTKVLDNGGSKLVPALGESWGHAASTRVILHWGPDNERHAHLFKSPFLPPATARYGVTPDGIRNVPKEQ